MKVQIYSRAEMEKQLKNGFNDETAVISFYDPDSKDKDYAPVDYSGQDIRLFQIGLRDIDISSLKMYGICYNDYFPEADELAEFILKAVNDDCTIICQCDYGQSRSAACAAAILEHFEKKGISIFADDKYLPNQMIFNKLMCSLKRVHTEPTVGEVFSTMREDRYYSYIKRSNRLCMNKQYDEALTILDVLLQIISSDTGEDSMYTACVCYYFARIYRSDKRFVEAEEMYRKSIENCNLHKQNRIAFRHRRSLAMMINEMGDKSKVISECEAALDEQIEFGDKVYYELARVMLGDSLYNAHRFEEAILQWQSSDNESTQVILFKISKAYEMLGNTEKAAEYLHRSQMADKTYQMNIKRLVNLQNEIHNIKTEMEEV